ncbi:MAG: divalent-cation tolerance protein CutA [Chthoniobacterales bacterium]
MIALILSTFEKEEDATAVIRTLLAEGLIACGTLLRGARSIYVWDDAIQDTTELFVLFKSSTDRAAETAERLAELHPYDSPEILRLDATASETYAAWVKDCTR